MDFDSLKINAKINSGSYEHNSIEMAKPSIKPSVESNTVKASHEANVIQNAEKAANQQNDDYTSEEYISKLSNAVDIANQSLKAMMIKKEFSYRIHEATNRVIVDVKNSDTGEIIKEIPSEENLDMIAKLQELAGIFIDEKR